MPANPMPARIDIRPDKDGNVEPGKGGMSVFETKESMPVTRLPVAHGGHNEIDVLFVLDESYLSSQLSYAAGRRGHGTIEPSAVMGIATFQQELCATHPGWTRA